MPVLLSDKKLVVKLIGFIGPAAPLGPALRLEANGNRHSMILGQAFLHYGTVRLLQVILQISYHKFVITNDRKLIMYLSHRFWWVWSVCKIEPFQRHYHFSPHGFDASKNRLNIK